MKKSDLLKYAEAGVRNRLREIQLELASLRREFPQLVQNADGTMPSVMPIEYTKITKGSKHTSMPVGQASTGKGKNGRPDRRVDVLTALQRAGADATVSPFEIMFELKTSSSVVHKWLKLLTDEGLVAQVMSRNGKRAAGYAITAKGMAAGKGKGKLLKGTRPKKATNGSGAPIARHTGGSLKNKGISSLELVLAVVGPSQAPLSIQQIAEAVHMSDQGVRNVLNAHPQVFTVAEPANGKNPALYRVEAR
jgi:MarR family protein